MDTELKFELNIALIPEESLANRHISISQKLAKQYPTLMQLNDVKARLALAPHLTLYQVPVLAEKLDELLRSLAEIAHSYGAPHLRATRYSFNKDEASFEVQYEVTGQLLVWQNHIIDNVNTLRGNLLLERDPAGHVVAELLQDKGVLGDNLRRTGYGEVGDPRKGGLFRPHVTLNWFELGTEVNENDESLPLLDTLSGNYPMLGVYLLGPYGTCPQRIAQYPCLDAAKGLEVHFPQSEQQW